MPSNNSHIVTFQNVDMIDPGYASFPDGLLTGGVGPCIAIAYLNITKGEAALIHQPGMASTGALDSFLSSLREISTASDDVRIALIGGDTSEDDDGTDVATDREVVERKVRATFQHIEPAIHWHDNGWCNVRVSTSPPEITIETYEHQH